MKKFRLDWDVFYNSDATDAQAYFSTYIVEKNEQRFFKRVLSLFLIEKCAFLKYYKLYMSIQNSLHGVHSNVPIVLL